MLKTETKGRRSVVVSEVEDIRSLAFELAVTVHAVACQAEKQFGGDARGKIRLSLLNLLLDDIVWGMNPDRTERLFEVDSPEDFWADDWPLKND